MNLLYYITSHGYGHASRSVCVANEFSSNINVIFRTTVPKQFFIEESKRPFSYCPKQFDCGCIQKDAITTDIKKTIANYIQIAEKNKNLLLKEINWCQKNKIDIIVSDIVPFAFDVSYKLGIPSVAITNFTWFDIYKDYSNKFPYFKPYLETIKSQYQKASLLISLFPALEMPYFKNSVKAGPVGRKGKNIRKFLIKRYGFSQNKKIGIIYTGNFGFKKVNWKKLSKFTQWEFFGLYPLPYTIKNYHLISKKEFSYQDFIASSDVVVGKLGYGTCAECLINGVPIIYLPRGNFAEYDALNKAMTELGFGYCLSKDKFYALDIEDTLAVIQKGKKPKPFLSNAAKKCAKEIEKLLN